MKHFLYAPCVPCNSCFLAPMGALSRYGVCVAGFGPFLGLLACESPTGASQLVTGYSGVGIDVPIVGDLFHVTKTNICWRWNISPSECWVMWNITGQRNIGPNNYWPWKIHQDFVWDIPSYWPWMTCFTYFRWLNGMHIVHGIYSPVSEKRWENLLCISRANPRRKWAIFSGKPWLIKKESIMWSMWCVSLAICVGIGVSYRSSLRQSGRCFCKITLWWFAICNSKPSKLGRW